MERQDPWVTKWMKELEGVRTIEQQIHEQIEAVIHRTDRLEDLKGFQRVVKAWIGDPRSSIACGDQKKPPGCVLGKEFVDPVLSEDCNSA